MAVLSFLFLLISGEAYCVETKTAPQKSGGITSSGLEEVTVRFKRHEGFSRIVFETRDESFIKNTSVSSAENRIRVQFPSNLTLKPQGHVDMETSLKGNVYTITPGQPFRTKVMRLSSPPRLSIDIMPAAKEEGVKPAMEGTSFDVFPGVRIVLDPGHGGYDPGILSGDLSAGGGREKDITLSLARTMEAALIRKNRAVYLTRRADQFLSITDRALFANQKSPDVFISIHLSLSDTFVINTSVSEPSLSDSPEGLYGLTSRQKHYAEKSRVLAESLGMAIKDEFKKDIIYRKMDLPLLASVGAPSVIIEVPSTIMYDQAMKTRISHTLLKGIASYAVK